MTRVRVLITAALAAAGLLTAGCTSGTSGLHGKGTPAAQYTGPTALPGADETTVASEETTTEPPTAPDLSRNEDLALENDDGATQAKVHLNSVITTKRPADSTIGDAPAHGTYVVVDVTITVTAGKLAVNPLYFAYQAPDGTTYDYGSGNALFAGFEPTLSSGDVPAGQRVRGKVVYDAQYGPGAKLLYKDELGSIVAAWKLA